MPNRLTPKGTVTLQPTTDADALELLRFETDNRAFFEKTLPSLGDAYFTLPGIEAALEARAKEMAEDSAYHYLVREAGGELVGRVGLYGVQRGPRQCAEIGYRVAAKHGGRGYAQAAVAQVVREAFGPLELHRLEGVTAPTNLASQLVLLKNGFGFWGRSRRSYLLHGVWEDCLFFESFAPAEH